MAWQCPATCGWFDESRRPVPGTGRGGVPVGVAPPMTPEQLAKCVDKPECTNWVRNLFCKTTFYSWTIKKENCPFAYALCHVENVN